MVGGRWTRSREWEESRPIQDDTKQQKEKISQSSIETMVGCSELLGRGRKKKIQTDEGALREGGQKIEAYPI